MKILSKLSLRAKLFGCFGLLLMANTAVSIHSVYTAMDLGVRMRDGVSASADKLDQARQITIGLGSMRSAIRGATLFLLSNRPDLES